MECNQQDPLCKPFDPASLSLDIFVQLAMEIKMEIVLCNVYFVNFVLQKHQLGASYTNLIVGINEADRR